MDSARISKVVADSSLETLRRVHKRLYEQVASTMQTRLLQPGGLLVDSTLQVPVTYDSGRILELLNQTLSLTQAKRVNFTPVLSITANCVLRTSSPGLPDRYEIFYGGDYNLATAGSRDRSLEKPVLLRDSGDVRPDLLSGLKVDAMKDVIDTYFRESGVSVHELINWNFILRSYEPGSIAANGQVKLF